MRLLRHIVATLALCAVFCVPSHADSTALNSLASKIVGAPTTVQCFPPSKWYAGYVIATADARGDAWRMEHVIHLAGDDCGALENVLNPGPRTYKWLHTRSDQGAWETGIALLVLTHEATHIILESGDEGLVECVAFRNVWSNLRLLSLDWKARQSAFTGAKLFHTAFPKAGKDSEYRSVC